MRYTQGHMKRLSARAGAVQVRGAIPCHRAVSGILLLMALPPVEAQQDYLQALEAEATKVSPSSTVVDAGKPAESPAAPASVAGRDRFESGLREQYRGAYVFYLELPENVREEYFSEFQRGVPVAELRDRIVDRYLQR